MVPSGWTKQNLKKIIKLSSGDTKPQSFSKIKSVDKPYPVYGGNNIMGYSSQYNSNMPVILIGRVGEYCGVTRYVEGKCWITDNALYTKEVSSSVYKPFLTSLLINYDLSRLRNKGGQPLISQKPIYNLEVSIPPLPEQQKIAEILTTWDKAIDSTERLIDNSKEQKKALMQQLLTGEKRLLDDNGKPFESEWEILQFKDCFKHVGGTALEKYEDSNSKYHFISIGNYSKDGTYIDKGQRIELNDKTKTKLLNKNDLVMVLNDKTKTGDIIGSTILIDEDDKYIYNQRSERIICNEGVNVSFFWFLLNSNPIRTEVFKRSQGGTQIYVNFGALETINIELPSLEEQEKIAAVLTNADKEIELLEQQLADLKQEKKALMQQLLTGKKRVTVD